jgi:arylsulfatase
MLSDSGSAAAQKITGVPGSLEATATIGGRQLPPPPQEFEGNIERNAAQSTPYWPMHVVPRNMAQSCCS